jgi:hypothetical protein
MQLVRFRVKAEPRDVVEQIVRSVVVKVIPLQPSEQVHGRIA